MSYGYVKLADKLRYHSTLPVAYLHDNTKWPPPSFIDRLGRANILTDKEAECFSDWRDGPFALFREEQRKGGIPTPYDYPEIVPPFEWPRLPDFKYPSASDPYGVIAFKKGLTPESKLLDAKVSKIMRAPWYNVDILKRRATYKENEFYIYKRLESLGLASRTLYLLSNSVATILEYDPSYANDFDEYREYAFPVNGKTSTKDLLPSAAQSGFARPPRRRRKSPRRGVKPPSLDRSPPLDPPSAPPGEEGAFPVPAPSSDPGTLEYLQGGSL